MPGFDVLSNAVAWLPWGSAAFARAQAERKPVLLSLAAGWCASCRLMDETTYADPVVASAINRQFIPVRVDVDDRPDVSERYTLGGWPTTVFLTPSGAMLGGGTFVPLERMPGILARVSAAFAERTGNWDAEAEAEAGTGAVASGSDHPNLLPEALREMVFASFDDRCAGFGAQPKFPLVAPVRLALRGAGDDPTQRHMAEATLDAMGWGGLYDEVDGGFFRCAAARDWSEPHSEKMLETNAALLRLYLDAGSALGFGRFTDRAADILRYVQTWLADPVDGGWHGAQRADAAYYAGSADDRRRQPPPAVSFGFFADWNAEMVSAALQAAAVFGDDGLRDFALKSLERVLLGCYRPGAGVAHSCGGPAGGTPVRGLLADQAAMADACLDAFDLTGNIVYEMMAEELVRYAVRAMWDEPGGGFFDRVEDPSEAIGLLGRRLKPFALNCALSQTLRRAAAASGDHEFTALADRALAAMAPLAAAQGPLAAHYLLALPGGVR